MPDITLHAGEQQMMAHVAEPPGAGPWPGVVVIHDALGMSEDLRRQTEWLVQAGYLAIAPDLFGGTHLFRCLFSVMRDMRRGDGPIFERVDSARGWLLSHDRSSGRVGVIGFCFGGSFALMLAPTGDYGAASVNYGPLSRKLEDDLRNACPIVGSYGGLDRNLKGDAARLKRILADAGIDHDVKEYADADHSFMNDHGGEKLPVIIGIMSRVFGGGEFHAEATEDARRRILAFFAKHLGGNQA